MSTFYYTCPDCGEVNSVPEWVIGDGKKLIIILRAEAKSNSVLELSSGACSSISFKCKCGASWKIGLKEDK